MHYSFEDKIKVIDEELTKQKGKWRLNALSHLDYDDIKQIIRIHVHKKWDKWDQSRPLRNWLSRVISHQIINEIRNNYGNVAPPCQGSPPCPFNQGVDACGYTSSGKKCGECPLYKKWEKTKQAGYNIKLAPSIDHPDFVDGSEVVTEHSDGIDIEKAVGRLNERMKVALSDHHYKVYRLLYIENETEEATAEQMGFKTSEKDRTAGYKQLFNIKKKIMQTARNLVDTEEFIYAS
jgi:DNA-directed RNA polymerase specialized sigma24 family protein